MLFEQHIERVIAIDPDTEKNGVATIDKQTRVAKVEKLTFAELVFNLLGEIRNEKPVQRTKIIIEGGWINEKSAFHKYANARVASFIGKSVGRNHETGRKIVECAEFAGVEINVIKPFKKCWKGSNGKITQEEINKLCQKMKVTSEKKRMNQDERDALLIALMSI